VASKNVFLRFVCWLFGHDAEFTVTNRMCIAKCLRCGKRAVI
jgi:hypothetical protein